jgi:hypothetical protein
MAADDHRKRQPFSARGTCGQHADDQSASCPFAEHALRRNRHRHGGFSGGDDRDGAGGRAADFDALVLSLSKGPLNETAGVDGSDTGPGNAQEVLSQDVERTSQ